MIPLTRQGLADKSDREIEMYLAALAKKLSEEKLIFCELYASGLTGKKAAQASGLNPTTVTNLLGNKFMQDAITLHEEQFSRRAEVTQDWRKNTLRSIAEKCMEDGKENIAVSAIKELNNLENNNRTQDTLQAGINKMIASIAVPINLEMELLSKVFHGLNYNKQSVEKIVSGQVIEGKSDE